MNNQAAQPREATLTTDELSLTYFEWGKPSDPTVLLVHATGFHARCWDQVVARLPKDVHVLAPDMRGHGRSDEVAPYNWASFGRDLQAFATALDIRDAIGVGHSMGGHCVTQLAGERTECFRELLLLDPVIFEPEAYVTNSDQGFATAEEHPVARRRERWDSWQDMQASLAGKGTFGLWDPQVFEDYCRYGVLPVVDENGAGDGVRLACPAIVEASVYLGSSETDVHQLIPNIRIPVTVLRAPPRDPGSVELDFSKSPTVPDLASRFVQAQDVLLAELTHFIPMQAPELVADYIKRAL